MQSLFTSHHGGKKSKVTEPTEREGFALAVATAMQWSKLRDSSGLQFFPTISHTVKRLEGTERDWSRAEIIHFNDKLFNGVPQCSIEQWIQKEFLGKRGEEITEHRKMIIENFMYRFLAACESGVDYETAITLANRAKVGEILQAKELGGRPEWTIDTFLSEAVWDELGGKAGLKCQARKLITIIACRGRKLKGEAAPFNPFCGECGELRWQHTGSRCHVQPIPCLCDVDHSGDVEQPATKRPRPAAARGMSDLDQSGQGIAESYDRKIKMIKTRYGNDSPQEIIAKLLGADVNADFFSCNDDASGVVTGEQGGRLLACYLFSVKDDASLVFLSSGVKDWLEKQLPKYSLHPVQKACIEHAIKFIPKLDQGLARASAARAPAPDFSSPAQPGTSRFHARMPQAPPSQPPAPDF